MDELLPFAMVNRLLMGVFLPLQDTVSAAVGPGTLEVAADISSLVLAGISALLLLVMTLLLFQLRRLLTAMKGSLQPVADRARVAAENVEYISAVVREDVQKVHASVAGLSDRLKGASERMEERVEEFNALMDVVQTEAESVLLDTAAAVRGVRAGARTISERVGVAPKDPRDDDATADTSSSGEVPDLEVVEDGGRLAGDAEGA